MASVVRAQLLEASSLFRRGYPAEGLRAVVGALLLIPENAAFSSKSALYPAATQGLGSDLLQAAHVAARAGNEGWAVALYRLAANDKKLSQEQALELESHLQAIEHWQTAKRSAGNVELAGDRAIYAAELAILSPSAENVASAGEAILTWIAAAKTMMALGRDAMQASRDEGTSSFLAARSGAITLAGLGLRSSDPKSALTFLEDERINGWVPPALVDELEGAREPGANSAAAWAALFSEYRRLQVNQGEGLIASNGVAAGAAFGASLALFRQQENSLRAVVPLTAILVEHQMFDAVPYMVKHALGDKPDARDIDIALSTLFTALRSAAAVEGLETARRLMAHSESTFALAETFHAESKSRSPSIFFELMGSLELASAEPRMALPWFEKARESRPSPETLRRLASVYQFVGEQSKAVEVTRELKDGLGGGASETAKAEALLLLSDAQFIADQKQDAQQSAVEALKLAKRASEASDTPAGRAMSFRALANAFERFGSVHEARRATLLALEFSLANPNQIVGTVLDGCRRAFSEGDVDLARALVREAIEQRLPGNELVYAAIWLRLTERASGHDTDGTVEAAMHASRDAERWPSVLLEWATGKMTDEELSKTAVGPVQKTEVQFYLAASSSDAELKKAGLTAVADSPALELVEVKLAKALLGRAPRYSVESLGGIALKP